MRHADAHESHWRRYLRFWRHDPAVDVDPSAQQAVRFPPKPPRMRWPTYLRRRAAWRRVADRRNALAISGAMAFLERLGHGETARRSTR
jgi:hypothetical protein